jgi:hypothetical protein
MVMAYRSDRTAVSIFAPLLLDWQLALPRGVADLEFVDIAEMMDGWLLSMLYGEGQRQIGFNQFNHFNEPSQHVVFLDDESKVTTVNQRTINRDYPALQSIDWWFSPPLHLLAEWPESLLNKGLTWRFEHDVLPTVPVFYAVTVALMLLSLSLAVWWLRDTELLPSRRVFWLINCALVGLPALLSLMLLEPRKARV